MECPSFHGNRAEPWCGIPHAQTLWPPPTNTLQQAGAVATEMAPRKNMKYAHLNAIHLFVPTANETFGMMGPEARLFCQDLGRASPQPHWIPSPTNTCYSAYQLLFSMAMLLLSWAHCRRAPLGLRSRA